MNWDIYTCACGKGFAVEEDEQPVCCPFCQSVVFEYSHTSMNMTEDDVLEIADYVALMGLQEVVSDQAKAFFGRIMIEARKIERGN